MIGIYKITSPSGRIYIGESKDIDKRWHQYRKLECKAQTRLYNSFLKYGVENHKFEAIKECNINEIPYWERYYQEFYNTIDIKLGLNCKLRNTKDKKEIWSDESKNKQIISLKKYFENQKNRESQRLKQLKLYENGYVNPNKGKKSKPESIEKMKKTKKEKIENGWVNPRKGSELSKSHIDSLRQAQLKLYKSGYKSPVSKQVINNQNGFIYDSLKEAHEASGLKINYASFTRQLNGERKNKTNFEYINNL